MVGLPALAIAQWSKRVTVEAEREFSGGPDGLSERLVESRAVIEEALRPSSPLAAVSREVIGPGRTRRPTHRGGLHRCDRALCLTSTSALGADAERAPIFNRKLRRAEVLRFFEKLPPCPVGLEACGSAHYWARDIAALGHDVRLIPPVYVKPFVKRGKTDAAHADAISEAVTRKTMHFVPIKSADQQAAAIMLKTRALLLRGQTQAINAIRGHLSELGIIAAIGTAKVAELIEIVRDDEDVCLPKAAGLALAETADQIEAVTARSISSNEESSAR